MHVVFGQSAAASLREALRTAGREETVLAPEDDFSFGPLVPADADVRARWVQDTLGYSEWAGSTEATLSIASDSAVYGRPPIAWISPDSASSVAGFLWWLSQLGDRPVRQNRISRLGLHSPNLLEGLLDLHVELTASDRGDAIALWQTLKRENAPLRVLTNTGLVSAPIEYFDDALLAHVHEDWQKMAFIVGKTLMGFHDEGRFQTGDLVLASRLRTLVLSGTIECRGDLYQMRHCELRLPSA